MLVRMDAVRCRRRRRIPRHVGEGPAVGRRIRLARRRGTKYGAPIRSEPVLAVLVGTDHEDGVWVTRRREDVVVVPALTGAEVEGCIPGVAVDRVSQELPAARVGATND